MITRRRIFELVFLVALLGGGIAAGQERATAVGPDPKEMKAVVAKAAAYLKAKNVRTLQGPIPIKEGPAAGQSILYFFAPWGLQMELISYPRGMAYEKDAKSLLWMTTEPMK